MFRSHVSYPLLDYVFFLKDTGARVFGIKTQKRNTIVCNSSAHAQPKSWSHFDDFVEKYSDTKIYINLVAHISYSSTNFSTIPSQQTTKGILNFICLLGKKKLLGHRKRMEISLRMAMGGNPQWANFLQRKLAGKWQMAIKPQKT